jgi:hypothetical protein
MEDKSHFKFSAKVKTKPLVDTSKVKDYPFVARFMEHFSEDSTVETDSILSHIKAHASMSDLNSEEIMAMEKDVYSLSQAAQNDLPLEREVAMIKLMEMRHVPNEHIQFLTTQSLEYLFSIPLTFTDEDEQKALKSILSCKHQCITDDISKRMEMIKHLTMLKRSNSPIVRQKATQVLHYIEKCPSTYSLTDVERALRALRRLQQMVLMKNHLSISAFKKILTMCDSLSPTVRKEAHEICNDCLSHSVRAR